MKLKINFFNENKIKNLLKDYNHIDFSLFVDCVPDDNNQLSKINIISLQEPNEYFGLHDWVLENKNLFNVVLTWSDKLLNNYNNALLLPFGHTWFNPEQYEKKYEKEFKVAHLCGILKKTYGHDIRYEILNRKNEIKIPIKFFHTYGDRNNIEIAKKDKVEIFGDSQFGVAIENTSHNNYFTEKIIDCFLLRTIPIYWGCSNIDKFFNIDGIIKFENPDHFIEIVNKLNDSYYQSKILAIEDNYQRALKYVDYERNIINLIIKIFENNNIK